MLNRIFPVLAGILLGMLPRLAAGQCGMVPLPAADRVQACEQIIIGKVTAQEPYLIRETGEVYTLNTITVQAWLKGSPVTTSLGLITEGGFVGNQGMMAWPAVQLYPGDEYIFFLENAPFAKENAAVRAARPGFIQRRIYAEGQGAWRKQAGVYHDLLVESPKTEAQALAFFETLTGQPAVTPSGDLFDARPEAAAGPAPLSKINAITAMAPNPGISGSTASGDYLTITGAGFGNTVGTVSFKNADDGGATTVASPFASDYISWSDGSITCKVPTGAGYIAGTGLITVNGSLGPVTSGSGFASFYGLSSINSDLLGFSQVTRQFYYHRNLNGAGGIYWSYNNTFAGNTAAVASFERAMQTWRCNTLINWWSNGNTSTSTTANDGVNLVMFDNSLAAGVIASCRSYFLGSSNGSCNQANGVWWLADVDILFDATLASSYTWNFATTAPTALQYDFETVALHELGHAHGLAHRIYAGQSMYWSIGSGVSIRTPHAREINGGIHRMNLSTAATCFNPAGSGTPMVTVTAGSCILPVDFLEFDALHEPGKGVHLFWNVARENGNAGYWIERSRDGVNYQDLHFEKGAGNTTESRQYSWLDASSLAPGRWLYRLRLMDINGAFSYSEVMDVEITGNGAGIWVNDAGNRVYFAGWESEHPLTVQILDMKGQVLQAGAVTGGMLELEELAAGMYICRAVQEGKSVSHKFILSE